MPLTLVFACSPIAFGTTPTEAPAAFDGQPVSDFVAMPRPPGATEDVDYVKAKTAYENVEASAHKDDNGNIKNDGLGPLYNATSCVACHQNPVTGGVSQISELRAGHVDKFGRFVPANIRINGGKDVIAGRTLVNDRAICSEYQERVPQKEKIRAFRMSLNTLGDGFVEAVADQTLVDISEKQCASAKNTGICGSYIFVPILEGTPTATAIGRFGWKNQHASLRSFSADAYLNEMGITTALLPHEFTEGVKSVPNGGAAAQQGAHPTDANDKQRTNDAIEKETGHEDAELFTFYMRGSKVPPRNPALVDNEGAKRGEKLFSKAGCDVCHVSTIVTASAGTTILNGTYKIPESLGDKIIHPYSDFLLHDIGTSDGIALSATEHYGVRDDKIQAAYYPVTEEFKKETHKSGGSSKLLSKYKSKFFAAFDQAMNRKNFSYAKIQDGRHRLRTAPLWGLHTHSRLMHDGESVRLDAAIRRHNKEAKVSENKYEHLSGIERKDLRTFLHSL